MIRKFSKKANGGNIMDNIVYLIIAGLVLAVALIFGYLGFKYGLFDWIKNLPFFGRGENAEFNEAELNFRLTNPDALSFRIYRVTGGMSLFYTCKKNESWHWDSKIDSLNLVKVDESEGDDRYENLGEADKELIEELRGESCEYGLNLMRVMVLEDKYGKWWSGTTRLLVYYSENVETFLPSSPDIKNIDDLIVRLNRFSDTRE